MADGAPDIAWRSEDARDEAAVGFSSTDCVSRLLEAAASPCGMESSRRSWVVRAGVWREDSRAGVVDVAGEEEPIIVWWAGI